MFLSRQRQPDALYDDKYNSEAQQAEQLELDPDLLAERVKDIQVNSPYGHKKQYPDLVQSRPLCSGQFGCIAQHALHHRFAADPLASQEDDRKCPIEYGWLPVEKGRVFVSQGEAAQYQYKNRGSGIDSVEFPGQQPLEQQYRRHHDHQHARRKENIPVKVRKEKCDDWYVVKQ